MKWWRQSDSNRPQLVCKTDVRTLRCPRIMVPEDGIEPPTRTPSTCRSTAELPRRNSEWRGPAESNRYHCAGSARHSQYTRSAFSRWWVTAESNRARAKAQALQARSVTRLGVTQKLVAGVRVERTFRGYEPRPGPGYRSGHPAKCCRGFKLLDRVGGTSARDVIVSPRPKFRTRRN